MHAKNFGSALLESDILDICFHLVLSFGTALVALLQSMMSWIQSLCGRPTLLLPSVMPQATNNPFTVSHFA